VWTKPCTAAVVVARHELHAGPSQSHAVVHDCLSIHPVMPAGSRYLEPDGMFPNHPPNPENKEAMASGAAAVLESGADLVCVLYLSVGCTKGLARPHLETVQKDSGTGRRRLALKSSVSLEGVATTAWCIAQSGSHCNVVCKRETQSKIVCFFFPEMQHTAVRRSMNLSYFLHCLDA
jgi:hypothetical protein